MRWNWPYGTYEWKDRKHRWMPWFAWHPVSVDYEGNWCWLCWVERKWRAEYSMWDYREMDPHNDLDKDF